MNRSRFFSSLFVFLELVKIKVTLLVTFTTFAGYVIYSHQFEKEMLIPVLGVLILSFGSAALNQYQEKEIDATMPRTKNRPIPSRKITPYLALLFSIVLLIIGLILLAFNTDYKVMLLGLFSVVWYNGVYTYLKRETAFAVVPGSLTGAIPPLIGWVSAGGEINNIQILGLSAYLFIWQVPHFWLLLIKYGKDYELAGLPSLSKVFNEIQINRITLVWIVATISSALILSMILNMNFILFAIVLFVSILLIGISLWQFIRITKGSSQWLFVALNSYTFIIIIALIVNGLNL